MSIVNYEKECRETPKNLHSQETSSIYSDSSTTDSDDVIESLLAASDSTKPLEGRNVQKVSSVLEDQFLLASLNFGKIDQELDAQVFKELAGKSGFQFGECFSLVEYAWSTKTKALVRIKIPNAVAEELSMYIIHPCIIDASLQTCIAIGSTDPDRNVIPIGLLSTIFWFFQCAKPLYTFIGEG